MSKLLDAALAYTRRGWSVIPVSEHSKQPLVKWTEFQSRRASEDEVEAWWTRFPKANIGIVTGKISGLVVVDVDVRKGAKPETIRQEAATPFEVKTGGGGAHLYYHYPNGNSKINNRVDRRGVDVRADGGYVIAPPSRHPETGKLYRWTAGSEDAEPAYPPAFVLENSRSTQDAHGTHDERWLSRVMQGVGEGERNDAATRLAGYFFGKKMAKEVVEQMMLEWNQKNDPPIPEKELATTIESVFKASQRPQKSAPKRPVPDSKSGDPFALTTFREYMSEFGGVDVNWLVEEWLPDQTIAMMVAPPGSYKTWVLLDLAVSIAGGFPFLGTFPVLHKRPVIIIQQEDYHGQIAERIATILYSRTNFEYQYNKDRFNLTMPPNLPIYFHPDRRFRFADSVVVDALEAKIKAIRPALVIIDPLYSTGETDDYMAGTVQNMFAIKNMRDKYKCGFLLAHHTGKRSESTQREDAWGSQFINAFMETGWQMRPKDKPGVVSIRRHFKVSQNIEEAELQLSISTNEPYTYLAALKKKEVKSVKEEKPGIVETLAVHGPMTKQQLADWIGEDRSTVSRKVDKLVNSGELKHALGGKIAHHADSSS